MTSSEGLQQHFSICLLWFLPEKECSFYTHLFCCTEMRWLFISSTAIWTTGSVASRARTKLTSSKCHWTRIWATYNVNETTQSLKRNLLFVMAWHKNYTYYKKNDEIFCRSLHNKSQLLWFFSFCMHISQGLSLTLAVMISSNLPICKKSPHKYIITELLQTAK